MAIFMKPFEGQLYAVMRILVGVNFALHGTQKLFDFPKAAPDAPAFVIFVAGGIELVGGAMVAAGFQTRWAAFLCSGLMAAAYWMAHGTRALLPIQNGGELAMIYCFAFLYIACKGGGRSGGGG